MTRTPDIPTVKDAIRLRSRLAALVPAHLVRRGLIRRLSATRNFPGGLRVAIAERYADRLEAIRLVHRYYVQRGIEQPDDRGFRPSHHHLSPCTTVFTAHVDGVLVGTISLIEDSPLGLPMEKVHAGEVHRMRERQRRIAEVGTLAVAPEVRGFGISFLLYNIMFRWARYHRGVEDLLIAVHPRGAPVYDKVLLFDRLGGVQSYPELNNARSVPFALDLSTASQRYRRVYDRRGMAFAFEGSTTNLYDFFFTDDLPQIALPRMPAAPLMLSPPVRWSPEDMRQYLKTCETPVDALPAFIRDAIAA